MQAGSRERAYVPRAPPQYDFDSSSSSIQAFVDKMNSFEHSSFSSSERILANQEEFQNDTAHMCSAI